MRKIFRAAASIAALCMAGCADMPGHAPAASADPSGGQVKVYIAGTLPAGGYDLVARLGVGSYWSAVDLPQYGSPEQGVEGLKREAARLGANGLMDPICMPDPNQWWRRSYFCAGNAVRVKPT